MSGARSSSNLCVSEEGSHARYKDADAKKCERHCGKWGSANLEEHVLYLTPSATASARDGVLRCFREGAATGEQQQK
jgi:hypothetical protein